MRQDFHRSAMARPDCPDYQVLYNLAEDELKRGDVPPESLAYKVYLIKSVRVRSARHLALGRRLEQLFDAASVMALSDSTARYQVH